MGRYHDLTKNTQAPEILQRSVVEIPTEAIATGRAQPVFPIVAITYVGQVLLALPVRPEVKFPFGYIGSPAFAGDVLS